MKTRLSRLKIKEATLHNSIIMLMYDKENVDYR